jgi:hypothetical protein
VRKLLSVALLVTSPLYGQAALVDRGGGMIYDDVLDVTWLQSTGGTGTGLGVLGSNVYNCIECFDGTNENTFLWNGLETGGWRLPKRLDPTLGLGPSEISYMFSVNLGLVGSSVPGGNRVNITTADGVTIYNVAEDKYWLAERWFPPVGDGEGFLWTFEIDSSPKLGPIHSNNYGALWWVRDGDVADLLAVPTPGSMGLVLAALGVLFLSAGRRRAWVNGEQRV